MRKLQHVLYSSLLVLSQVPPSSTSVSSPCLVWSPIWAETSSMSWQDKSSSKQDLLPDHGSEVWENCVSSMTYLIPSIFLTTRCLQKNLNFFASKKCWNFGTKNFLMNLCYPLSDTFSLATFLYPILTQSGPHWMEIHIKQKLLIFKHFFWVADIVRKECVDFGLRIRMVSVFFLPVKTQIFLKIQSTFFSTAAGWMKKEDDLSPTLRILSLTNQF